MKWDFYRNDLIFHTNSNFLPFQQRFLGLSNILMIILLTVIYANLFIFEVFWKNQTNHEVQQSLAVYNNLTVVLTNENDENEPNDRQMTRTVKAISLLFVVCWSLFFVVISQNEADYSFVKYTFLLALIKSTLNPFLCLWMNSEFRNLLMKLKFWWKRSD